MGNHPQHTGTRFMLSLLRFILFLVGFVGTICLAICLFGSGFREPGAFPAVLAMTLGTIPFHIAINIACVFLDAVESIHRQEAIHRDLATWWRERSEKREAKSPAGEGINLKLSPGSGSTAKIQQP